MVTIVRKLEKKIWFLKEDAEKLGGLQADALKNFKTTQNALSVYQVDGDIVPLNRILAALAGTRDSLQELDYALFDSQLLDTHDIDTNASLGETADEEVNKRHLDLIQLTAPKLCALAASIQEHGSVMRISKNAVKNAVKNSISQKRIKKEELNAKLIPKLGE